jgi:hypothetical protein
MAKTKTVKRKKPVKRKPAVKRSKPKRARKKPAKVKDETADVLEYLETIKRSKTAKPPRKRKPPATRKRKSQQDPIPSPMIQSIKADTRRLQREILCLLREDRPIRHHPEPEPILDAATIDVMSSRIAWPRMQSLAVH